MFYLPCLWSRSIELQIQLRFVLESCDHQKWLLSMKGYCKASNIEKSKIPFQNISSFDKTWSTENSIMCKLLSKSSLFPWIQMTYFGLWLPHVKYVVPSFTLAYRCRHRATSSFYNSGKHPNVWVTTLFYSPMKHEVHWHVHTFLRFLKSKMTTSEMLCEYESFNIFETSSILSNQK